MKKLFLKISSYSQQNTCVGVSFSWSFSKIFKNAYFSEHLQTAAFVELGKYMCLSYIYNSMHQYQIWNFWFMRDCPTGIKKNHCVKSVQIGSFFWFVFSHIRTEYGEIRSISPYSVEMRENTDQKKTVFGHFSSSKRLKICI